MKKFNLESQAGLAISKIKDTIPKIMELDSMLTKISKTSRLAEKELKQLGTESYLAARRYGKDASDYLSSLQRMSQSGFHGEAGMGMAEQSLLAQSAGGMEQETADKYILAANAAYKFNGEASKINEVLDGQNNISSRNKIALKEIASAMVEAGAAASNYNVTIEELSAMIATMESITRSGGSEVGNSIKTLLTNLQNAGSDKITDTLDKANVSMTEMASGAEQLRNPISILRDLAKTFSQLNENDPLKAEILANIGGQEHAAQLSALLQNMNMFDKMLVDYSEGKGSAFEAANKSANNLSGTLNKLSNSWTELVGSMVNSDEFKTGANLLDSMIQGAAKLVSVLTPLGTIGAGAGLFADLKNTGKCRMSIRIS